MHQARGRQAPEGAKVNRPGASAYELNRLAFEEGRAKVELALRQAGLVTVRREGQSMIYAARFETMNALLALLTENCCGGEREKCAPTPVCKPACGKRSKVSA
jgi:DNA-binding transcriptional ArsR family regulator